MTSIKAKLTAVLASAALAASMAVPAFAYEQVEDTVSYGHGYNDAGYLVIHETANPGASAYNHTLLWSRDDTYAVHYVMELDGSVVYHTVPDGIVLACRRRQLRHRRHRAGPCDKL